MEIKASEIAHLQLFRLTNKEENHRGFQYKDGLNVDTNKFNPSGECEKGGLYFFANHQLLQWASYIKNPVWIRRVRLTRSSRVYKEHEKYKTNQFILGPRELFDINHPEKYINLKDEKEKLEAVKENGLNIAYIKNPSIEVQKAAIMNNTNSLQYITMPCEEIQIFALYYNVYSIGHIGNPTPRLIECIKKDFQGYLHLLPYH